MFEYGTTLTTRVGMVPTDEFNDIFIDLTKNLVKEIIYRILSGPHPVVNKGYQ